MIAFISYRCRLDFKLFLLLLQRFGYIQFKERSRYVQGKHFNKSEKAEKSNRLADQDQKAAAFWFYPVLQGFKLYLQSFRQIQSEN